jgi:hypothetical protein
MKLEIELVPESSHFKNLRSELTTTQWSKLRKKYLPENGKCEICGGVSPGRGLDLHEVWSYTILDKEYGIQRLERLEGLCMYCHEVKHYYLANLRGFGERARNRLKKINKLSYNEVLEYENKVHTLFLIRSKIKWSIDFNGFDFVNIKG